MSEAPRHPSAPRRTPRWRLARRGPWGTLTLHAGWISALAGLGFAIRAGNALVAWICGGILAGYYLAYVITSYVGKTREARRDRRKAARAAPGSWWRRRRITFRDWPPHG